MSAAPEVLRQRLAETATTIAVLLVSPNARLRQELREKLHSHRWSLREAVSGAEALEHLHEHSCEVLLLDPQIPDLEFNEFSAMVGERFPGIQMLTVNGQNGQVILGSTSPTPLSTQLAEMLHPPVDAPPAAYVSETQLQRMRHGAERTPGLRGVVGESPAMLRVYEHTHMVARRDTTVLITGSSGTGKDLIAQAIHLISARHKQPLVVINCAAIPESLLEAELFGYAKGSFTGAVQSRTGRIHAAHGGTLFLDEIGDMPLALQSKILRFLEQGEVQRIGGNDNLKVDVRVVAATNADLQTLVKQKLFREDLYYRLAIFPIKLPDLSDRHGDIERLAASFINKFSPGATISPAAMDLLRRHDWPGNVRELRNVLERCSILSAGAPEILPCHILL